MTSLTDLESHLKALLGASATFYPGGKAQLDDYYEAYLWAETADVARSKSWIVSYVNAGPSNDAFTFRRGPGRLTSKKSYTYATLFDAAGRQGELHIGIKVQGDSGVLHEFDVVALNGHATNVAQLTGQEPKHDAARVHIEAKFHLNDLSLGTARSIVGLQHDCPSIRALLVSRASGSQSLRKLIKHHGGIYVHNAIPKGTGVAFLRKCVGAALARW